MKTKAARSAQARSAKAAPQGLPQPLPPLALVPLPVEVKETRPSFSEQARALLPRLGEIEAELGPEKARIVGDVLAGSIKRELAELRKAQAALKRRAADAPWTASMVAKSEATLGQTETQLLELADYVGAAVKADQFERGLGAKGGMALRRANADRAEGARIGGLAHSASESRKAAARKDRMRKLAVAVWKDAPNLTVRSCAARVREKARRGGAIPDGWGLTTVQAAIRDLKPR